MEVSIETAGLRMSRIETQTFCDYVRSRIDRTFARVKRRITHVAVQFEDVSGPAGEAKRHCIVKVRIGQATASLAQGQDRNLFVLVNRVSSRAADAALSAIRCRRRAITSSRCAFARGKMG